MHNIPQYFTINENKRIINFHNNNCDFRNDYENAMKSVEFFYGKNDENAKNILNELIDTNENKKNEKEEKGNFKVNK